VHDEITEYQVIKAFATTVNKNPVYYNYIISKRQISKIKSLPDRG